VIADIALAPPPVPHPAVTVVRSSRGESIILSFSKLLPVPRMYAGVSGRA
jgi:hypothetical protein